MKLPFAAIWMGLALAGCAGKKTALAAAPTAVAAMAADPGRAARPPEDPAATPVAFAPDDPGGAVEGPRPGCTPIGGEPPTCQ